MQKPSLLVIVGPTASGKTALAVECAKKFNGEIISADSMQIYKGMSIATAKPTASEMQGIPHHLIDFLDVASQYSVAQFVSDAESCCEDIISRGKLPVLAGGTGLYVDSFVNNIKFSEADSDEALRKKLNDELKSVGAEKMLERLAEIDPEYASKLHPNNEKRIIRAFEIYTLTGKTPTEAVAQSRLEPTKYNCCFIGINYKNRDVLYDRINRRVDLMVENGLVEEAKSYYALPKKSTASQAIGYKELKPYFDGEISLEQALENLKIGTRHYAKRQLTWFRRNENIKWFYPDEETGDSFYEEVFDYIKKVI